MYVSGSARGRSRSVVSPIRISLSLLVAVAAVAGTLLAASAPASASSWRFEAEDIDLANCHDGGGSVFEVRPCSAASGGFALEGLDTTGDWVEIRVSFESQTCFVDSIRCAGSSSASWEFQVDFFPEGSTTPVATNVHAPVPGRGVT